MQRLRYGYDKYSIPARIIVPRGNDLSEYMREGMTDKRKKGKGTKMNIPSVLKLTVAVFFVATLPIKVHALTPDQVFDKVKASIVVVNTLDAQGERTRERGAAPFR